VSPVKACAHGHGYYQGRSCPTCVDEWARRSSARKRLKWQARIWESQWRRTRQAVFARDGYRCFQCGRPRTGPRTIGAHHLDPLSEANPADWFDISRIVTLCSSCHGQADGTRARHVSPQQPEPTSTPFIA
jgi:5-methylcytosine-specific restriction endonuclease McrA